MPGIKEQLALLPKQFVNKIQEAEQQQKAQRLLEEPISGTLPPPLLPELKETPERTNNLERILADYEKQIKAEDLPETDISKLFEGYEKEKAEELGAKPKEFNLDLNNNVDLYLLDSDKYYTPQVVFVFYHTKSDDPNVNMTRKETEDMIDVVSGDIRLLSSQRAAISRKKSPTPLDKKLKANLIRKSDNLKNYKETLKHILIQRKYMEKEWDHLTIHIKFLQMGNMVIYLLI